MLEAPARVGQGAPVPLVFTIVNTGTESITLQVLGRAPTADFQVLDTRGLIVWTRLRGASLMAPLRLVPLDPGQSLSFRQVWNQRTDAGGLVEPDEYLARGVLLTDDPQGLASPPARIRIER